MLAVNATTRVYLYMRNVDMRRPTVDWSKHRTTSSISESPVIEMVLKSSFAQASALSRAIVFQGILLLVFKAKVACVSRHAGLMRVARFTT